MNASTTARTASHASITARRGQAVGDDPADQGERHARDHERGQHAAERRRRPVDREDGKGERDGDERVPDRGGDAAEPEQAEARLPKWGERLRRTHGLAP